MKKFSLALTFLAALPLALAAQVTKEDLKKLAAAGISDDVILSYIKANGGVAKLSADDVIELRQAGATEKVLSAALGASPAASAPAPAESRPYTAERTYDYPSTTYVYNTTPAYYTPAVSYSVSLGYGSYYPYYYPYAYPRYYNNCYPRTYGYTGYYGGYRGYGGAYCPPRVGYSAGYSTSRGYSGVSGYRR